MKKYRIKSIVILTFLFIIAYSIAFSFITSGKEPRINIILSNHTKTLRTFYEILQYNQKITADVAFEETINNPNFMKVLSQANIAEKNGDQKQINILHKRAFEILKDE